VVTDAEAVSATPGRELRRGRYLLLDKIAEGGMGSVHLALRDGASAPCVLKQIRANLSNSAVAARRFYREAHIGSQLNHPRIARVLGAGTEGGVFCFAMELVLGLDLGAIHSSFRKQAALLPTPLVIHIALDVLDGLAYAHTAADGDGGPLGVVHRDITPRNIMVSFAGETKLIDFGLVRSLGGNLTIPGAFLGTPSFASPEQALGEAIDHRSDLYSLSVVLFELLTGVALVRHKSVGQMLHAICTVEAPQLRDVNPAVSPQLSAAIARGLEKKADARWPDASTYAQALREAIGQQVAIDAGTMATFMRDHFSAQEARSLDLLRVADGLIRRARAQADTSSPESVHVTTKPERDIVSIDEGEASAPDSFIDFHSAYTAIAAPLEAVREEPTFVPTVEAIRQPSSSAPRASSVRAVAVPLLTAAAASAMTALFLRTTSGPVTPSPSTTLSAAPSDVPVPRALPPPVTAPPGSTAPSPARALPVVERDPRAPASRTSPKPAITSAPPSAPPTPSSPIASPRAPTHPPTLREALDRLTAAPGDGAARRALIEDLESHPDRARIERNLVQAKMALTPQAAVRELKLCVDKLEPFDPAPP